MIYELWSLNQLNRVNFSNGGRHANSLEQDGYTCCLLVNWNMCDSSPIKEYFAVAVQPNHANDVF